MSHTEAPRILVAGSINTDLVMQVAEAPDRGQTVTGQSFATFGGGKGANQAVAAVRSGANVSMLGGVGNDDFGRQRLADLDAERVSLQAISVFDDLPSGVAIILVDLDGDNRIAYVPGATWGVDPTRAHEALQAVDPAVVLATLEHRRDTLEALWEGARERGSTVICNATPEPAAGRDLAFGADILVVNEVEAAELLEFETVPLDPISAAKALRTEGPPCVVITLGSSGALVSTREADLAIEALKVNVVDTTAAGDAFCGAFAAEIGRGSDVFDAARVGVVAGSLAVTRSGAQPSMPSRAEIEAALTA